MFAPLFRSHEIAAHKRVGVPGTLHRLSLTTHPAKNDVVIAVTARVGRAMEGVITRMAPFLLPLHGPSSASGSVPSSTAPDRAPDRSGTAGSSAPIVGGTSPSVSFSGSLLSSLRLGGPSRAAEATSSSNQQQQQQQASKVMHSFSFCVIRQIYNLAFHRFPLSKSLLLIGRPGVGKTTLLRELAFALSSDHELTVVVVDKVIR